MFRLVNTTTCNTINITRLVAALKIFPLFIYLVKFMLMNAINYLVKRHPQVQFPAKSQCSGQHTCSVNKTWWVLFLPSVLVETFRGFLYPQQQNSDILYRSICIASFKKEINLNTPHYSMLKFEFMTVLPYVMVSLFFFRFRLFYFFIELTPHILLHAETDCGLYNTKIGRSAPRSITRLKELGNIELHLRFNYDYHNTSILIYTYLTFVCV